MVSVCHIRGVRGPQPPHNSLPNPWYWYETWYRYNNPSIGIGIGMSNQPGIDIGLESLQNLRIFPRDKKKGNFWPFFDEFMHFETSKTKKSILY